MKIYDNRSINVYRKESHGSAGVGTKLALSGHQVGDLRYMGQVRDLRDYCAIAKTRHKCVKGSSGDESGAELRA